MQKCQGFAIFDRILALIQQYDNFEAVLKWCGPGFIFIAHFFNFPGFPGPRMFFSGPKNINFHGFPDLNVKSYQIFGHQN